MRWSIIRLIWLRDLRDQLRDRRTILMIALLPLVLYPILGMAVLQFAVSFIEKPSRIGIVRWDKSSDFPARQKGDGGLSPGPVAAWLTCTPGVGGAGLDRGFGAVSLASMSQWALDDPLLVRDGRFVPAYTEGAGLGLGLKPSLLRVQFLDSDDRGPLDDKQVDLILSAPADFWSRVEQGGPEAAYLKIQTREGDDRSRQASARLYLVLAQWKKHLKEVRLVRRGLPAFYDYPVIEDWGSRDTAGGLDSKGLLGLMIKIFPFMLVMWSLAGALYPAVDLCAGEKERGTMETLIISPASREEIVLGKFLTIWVFSAATSLLNLLSMGLTSVLLGSQVPGEALRPMGLFWCVVLVLPLSAFFSAICLAVGAYARSSKEGQYYLMPLFLVTMPLVFLTLAPGVELSPFYSLVPVTGVALLMQRLMGGAVMSAGTWFYFVPVLAPMALYSWLALRWAIEQFKREEVLFREAERLDIMLWLRRLFREKETLPSAGQAAFCFALIIGLRWLSLGMGGRLPPLVHMAIVLLAFVATPAVFMAVVLTTRPIESLGLSPARPRAYLKALILAAVVVGPLVQLTLAIYEQLDKIKELVQAHQGMVDVFTDLSTGEEPAGWALFSLVLLPAVCEEIAFRGFILNGLRRRFRPWPAIALSSFLFALYHMDVFQFLPTFVLGVALSLLTVRSSSILPAMLFHLLHNGLLVGSAWLPQLTEEMGLNVEALDWLRLATTVVCTILAVVLLGRIGFASPLPRLEKSADR
jgi:sodium transport system permease protein